VSESNVIKLAQPGVFSDSLTEILRSGGRALVTQAVEGEVAEFLAKYADLKTETGHQRVVRHGHLPEREIMTGIGPVAVRQPRVRDREAAQGERIRYSPSILPRYARRSTAPSDRKAACRTRPRSPWSSSLSRAPRKLGAGSTATTSCQN
jgi:putative transposase